MSLKHLKEKYPEGVSIKLPEKGKAREVLTKIIQKACFSVNIAWLNRGKRLREHCYDNIFIYITSRGQFKMSQSDYCDNRPSITPTELIELLYKKDEKKEDPMFRRGERILVWNGKDSRPGSQGCWVIQTFKEIHKEMDAPIETCREDWDHYYKYAAKIEGHEERLFLPCEDWPTYDDIYRSGEDG